MSYKAQQKPPFYGGFLSFKYTLFYVITTACMRLPKTRLVPELISYKMVLI